MRLKNVQKMRPMERFCYLRSVLKVCTKCNTQNRLSLFFNKEENVLNKYCNKCNKKIFKEAIMKIVLSTIKSGKYNEI